MKGIPMQTGGVLFRSAVVALWTVAAHGTDAHWVIPIS
jgi:hypothetical protein